MEIHTFPKGISPKVNVMEQLEFDLTYYDVTATGLFPFANQWPRQEIWSLTDQSTGRAH